MTGAHLARRRLSGGARPAMALLVTAFFLANPAGLLAQEAWPIDRWLVAVAPDASADFEADALAAPGEAGVLPERGRTVAGATWELLREDGASSFVLDSILDGPEAGTVAYAHAYVRLSSDRTLQLRWSGTECTRTAAWLNGRPVPGDRMTGGRSAARFGAGWNTLLLKLQAGDCPLGFRATLRGGGEASDVEPPGVQASRPYGDVRTGPEDWVVPADTARIADQRRWRADRLYAGLAVEVTAWARAAVADVELELRDGLEGRATAAWLVPAEPVNVVLPVRLDRLDRVRSAGAAALRLAWGDRESDHRIVVAGTPPGPSSPVVLDGWKVTRSGRDAAELRSNDRLPTGADWQLEGEWEVPEALAGRSLALDVQDAPADYSLNGNPAPVSGGEITLCSPCTRGVELRLAAVSTDGWTSLPVVRMEP